METIPTPEIKEEESLIDESVQHEPLEKKFIFAGGALFLILIISFIGLLGGGNSTFRHFDQLNQSLAQPPKEVAGAETNAFGVEPPPPTTPTPKSSATLTEAPSSTAAPTSAPTTAPAPTTSPTNTPEPTHTPTPTPTETPTPTVSPTPEP
jgi:hypothetical protein